MSQQTSATSLEQLRAPKELPSATLGFFDSRGFDLMQRAAKLLSNSTLVPSAYRAWDEKKGDNPNALSNCVVALNMAQRMSADPLMICQNLYIVEGRPSWSSQWIIAQLNSSGKFSPLRFAIRDIGEKTVEYNVTEWVNRERVNKKLTAVIMDRECIAWAIERETGERIPGPAVTMEMAVKEGWYGKNGSKWQTMPEMMLRYRAASFFGKLYAPELLMGLMSVEEAGDVYEAEKGTDGGYSVPVESLRTAPAQAAQAEPVALEHLESMEIPQQTATASPAMATVNATAKATPRARVSME